MVRMWCDPEKYSNGKGSCNAGIRNCVPSGMPNAGQCCARGASPCGFHLHEGAWMPCSNSSSVATGGGGDRTTGGVAGKNSGNAAIPISGGIAIGSTSECGPQGSSSSVSFAISNVTAGEWLENYTAPIVGPNACPANWTGGTFSPWILSNGTIFVYNSLQIITARTWNAEYTVLAENVALGSQGGEDPFLWVDENDHFHLLYHRMNDGLQTGGHAFSADGKDWTWAPPAYDASVRYSDPMLGRVRFASRERSVVYFCPVLLLSTLFYYRCCTCFQLTPSYADGRATLSAPPYCRVQAPLGIQAWGRWCA